MTLLRDRTVRSVRVTILGTVCGAVLQVAILVTLARILTPLDYGSYAVALIVIQPLQQAVLSTVERAIVLQSAISEESLEAVSWVIFALMVLLAIVVGGAGLLVWKIFAKGFGATLAVSSLVLPFNAWAMVGRARLRRSISFTRLVGVDFAAQLMGTGGVSIAAAALGFGSLSLAVGSITQVAIQAVLYSRGVQRTNWTRPNLKSALPVLKSAYLLGRISVLEIVQGQLPSLFVSVYLGPVLLGLFSRAYSLVQLPIELLTNAMSRVLYSSFVAVRDDEKRLQGAIHQLIACATVLIFPIAVGMAVAAPDLVEVVLGRRWIATAPLLTWLTVGSALTMTGYLFATVLEASLHLTSRLVIQVATVLVTVVLFLLLTRHGIDSASMAFATAWLFYFVAQAVSTVRLLHLRVSEILLSLLPGMICAACVGLFIYVQRTLLADWPIPARLFVEVLGSALLLPAILKLMFSKLFHDLVRYSGIGQLMSQSPDA